MAPRWSPSSTGRVNSGQCRGVSRLGRRKPRPLVARSWRGRRAGVGARQLLAGRFAPLRIGKEISAPGLIELVEADAKSLLNRVVVRDSLRERRDQVRHALV